MENKSVKQDLRSYINEAFRLGKDMNTVKNGVYSIVSSAIKNNEIDIKRNAGKFKTVDDYVFDQEKIYLTDSDFFLSYMYATNQKSLSDKMAYNYSINSNCSSVIEVCDAKYERPIFAFVDKFYVSALFDLINKKQNKLATMQNVKSR